MRQYSPDKAAGLLLGWKGKYKGKKLLRKILQKEKLTGRQIAKRSPGRNGRESHLLSEDVLRGEFPELFLSSPSDIATELRTRLHTMASTVSENVSTRVDERVSLHSKQIAGLLASNGQLRELINSEFANIRQRLSALEGRYAK